MVGQPFSPLGAEAGVLYGYTVGLQRSPRHLATSSGRPCTQTTPDVLKPYLSYGAVEEFPCCTTRQRTR